MLAGHFGIYHLTSFQLLQGIFPPHSPNVNTDFLASHFSSHVISGIKKKNVIMCHVDDVLIWKY